MGRSTRQLSSMKLLIFFGLIAFASARYSPLVVGGQDVSPPGKYPWQGSLQRVRSRSHTCGVSVISSQHVTSAAHCVGAGITGLYVVLGLHDRTTKQQGQPENIGITSINVHPGWRRDGSRGFPNDVAVIKLAYPYDPTNRFISPISLAPNDGRDYAGDDCVISGWGRLFGFGPLPNVLQEAKVDVLTQSDCIEYWGTTRINDGHVCIMDSTTEDKGACNGDSGGPLACRVGGVWNLVGITSWVRSGCVTSYPSVYARVSYYNSWIRANMV